MRGVVEAWLPAHESCFLDSKGLPAPLWRVRYTTAGSLEGELEDLEVGGCCSQEPYISGTQMNALFVFDLPLSLPLILAMSKKILSSFIIIFFEICKIRQDLLISPTNLNDIPSVICITLCVPFFRRSTNCSAAYLPTQHLRPLTVACCLPLLRAVQQQQQQQETTTTITTATAKLSATRQRLSS